MDLVLFFLLLYPACIAMIDSFLRLLYLIVVRSYVPLNEDLIPSSYSQKTFFLIVACNEDKVIGNTLAVLFDAINHYSLCSIGVICDHCTDNTEKIALEYGVQIFARHTGQPGKGPALSWFLENHPFAWKDDDIIVILDADSQVDTNFYKNIQKPFLKGFCSAQAFVQPVFIDPTLPTLMASYSELLSQHIDDMARTHLAWSVPLRGTGMAFRGSLFREIFVDLNTQVEDIEISIRLATKKIPTSFEPSAIIYDPKSHLLLGLAKQRGRWLRGQREILALMASNIWYVIRCGLSGLSLIQALLFKPKTFLFSTKLALLIIAFFVESDLLKTVLFFMMLLSIIPDLLYYFIGLKVVDGKVKFNSLIINFILYVFLWLISLSISLFSKETWLRVRTQTQPLSLPIKITIPEEIADESY